MGWCSSSSFAFFIRARSVSALAQPVGRMGPIFSPRWSCGGARTMPVMSALSCTARCRKDEPGRTLSPAASAMGLNSGLLKSHSMSSSLSSPSMEPALCETMVRSSNGRPSSPPSVTMLQR